MFTKLGPVEASSTFRFLFRGIKDKKREEKRKKAFIQNPQAHIK